MKGELPWPLMTILSAISNFIIQISQNGSLLVKPRGQPRSSLLSTMENVSYMTIWIVQPSIYAKTLMSILGDLDSEDDCFGKCNLPDLIERCSVNDPACPWVRSVIIFLANASRVFILRNASQMRLVVALRIC